MIKFKVTELLDRMPGYAAFVDSMVKESLADPRRPPPRVPTTEQAPSTVAALAAQALRDPLDDVAWSQRPLPENYLAVTDAENLDELTGKRTLGIEETLLVEDIRHKAKNNVGDNTHNGETSRDTKRKAVDAYYHSKPAVLTPEEIKRVTKLTPMHSVPLEPEAPKKRTVMQWLFGVKDIKDGML